jgi:DNA repair protein RecN (Recombination protein N)
MLTALSIRDIVLIEALDLDIEPGFTALTGETGAGKSILLDALMLALGERAERGLVRAGAERAQATAVFAAGPDHPVHALLGELDLPPAEEGEVILRRSVAADGRSRASVNDAPASVSALKRLAACLIEVHGQHASTGLMDPGTHRGLLDLYARAEGALADVGAAFEQWREARAQLELAQARLARAGTEREWLAHVVAELDRLAPQEGEEAALDAERRGLMDAEKGAAALREAATALDDNRLEQRLTTASRALARLSGPGSGGGLPAEVEVALACLDRAINDIAEAQNQITRAGRQLDGDPRRLELIEERLFALRAAARKHGVGADGLAGVRARAAAELAALEAGDEAVDQARRAVAQAEDRYRAAAGRLSQLRQTAATGLDAAVMAELPPLKLEKARFRTRVESDPERPGRDGIDKVTFEIAPNPGAGFGPLSQIASGGELSRLSLALKVVLSADGGTLALVFDEVDQGIGGATADAVGRRLAVLAGTAQVLCVTHSPQVAARATHHWRIEKAVAGGRTATRVSILSAGEREAELARMLSGADVTDAALAAARALMG